MKLEPCRKHAEVGDYWWKRCDVDHGKCLLILTITVLCCSRCLLHSDGRKQDHLTNEEVRAKIQQAIGPHEDLLTIVKRRKLQWYGHVSLFLRSGQNHLARHSEREKTRQTEEEAGRQHQGMDRPGVRQVPEGSWEQGKMEKTGCKIICGDPRG